MPSASNQGTSQYYEPVAIGPVAQTVPVPLNAIPGTLNPAASWQSGILPSDGYKGIAFGAKLTQAGTITIQRYLDAVGLFPIGAPVTVTLVANTVNAASVNDGTPFSYYQITVTNTGGVAATLTTSGILLAAA